MISDFSPVYCEDKGGDIVTQFDKGDVEDVGLVKFDFLGLKNLTIIKNASSAGDKFVFSEVECITKLILEKSCSTSLNDKSLVVASNLKVDFKCSASY